MIDLALLTDGLRAEREQGITIDVAYRYFSTPRRKFIIADTPGHEQYTRNMATGASTADLAIILIDARNGVLPQSRRHAFIADAAGHPALRGRGQQDGPGGVRRGRLRRDPRRVRGFRAPASALRDLHFIPISALDGDNVVDRSAQHALVSTGPALLEYLETVPHRRATATCRHALSGAVRDPARIWISAAIAGQIASGVIRPGDRCMALPSRPHQPREIDRHLRRRSGARPSRRCR